MTRPTRSSVVRTAFAPCLTLCNDRSGTCGRAAATDVGLAHVRPFLVLAIGETDVVYGAETCIRVGACTRSQRGRRDSLCPEAVACDGAVDIVSMTASDPGGCASPEPDAGHFRSAACSADNGA